MKILQWMITGRCNYRCRHCYLGDTPRPEPGTDFLLSRIPLMKNAGVETVYLTGGEPLLRKDFLILIQALTEQGIQVGRIGTNGSLLTEEHLRRFSALGQQPEICLSYDGTGAHSWLRGKADAEERVIRTMDLCRERGFSTRAEMTLHTGNLHCLRSTGHTLADHGCIGLKAVPCFPVGAAAKDSGLKISAPEEMLEAACEYIPQYYEDDLPLEVDLYAWFYARGPRDVWTIPAEAPLHGGAEASLCMRDVRSPYLTEEGRLLPCPGVAGLPEMEREFPLFSGNEEESMAHPAFRHFTEYTVKKQGENNPECGKCPFLARCGGGCRMVPLSCGEGFHGRDLYLCTFFRGGWGEKVRAAVREGIRLQQQRKGRKNG